VLRVRKDCYTDATEVLLVAAEITWGKRKTAPRVFSSYTDKLHYPKEKKEYLLQTRHGTVRMVIGHLVDLDFCPENNNAFQALQTHTTAIGT
jgi:hypothetical protein